MNNFMAIKCTNFMTKGNKPNNNKRLPIKKVPGPNKFH